VLILTPLSFSLVAQARFELIDLYPAAVVLT
jgi:hypothetical protein